MAFNRIQARPLCTNAEYTLFTSSLAGGVTELTPAQLRSRIERTRKLRDKYRDLFQRQRLANRARTGTRMGERPDTNERTRDKATLFDEALGRFEARAAKLAAAAERDARRKAVREARLAQTAARKKGGAKPAAAPGRGKPGTAGRKRPGAAGYTSESARAAAHGKMARDNRAGARKGQATAAGKRSQARRDSRR
ncbi:hypothetical protein [Thioalkalivibrio thiocyanodenitrificans]|uniref:hypothetical protein n=1 Tax=Thioalkalivibrio thiocyanodenitrificans TaxID=243063 RepID=UPI00036BDFD1|nr:hypothetical protein [Thioalkalivibrio thiocyanodenitrificans]